MTELPSDQEARERFTRDWGVNLAVVANAGSGKTTAISERLAAMALSPAGAALLARTTVVTYTKKAAAQIGQRARAVLLRRMAELGHGEAEALGRLDRVFFGTIHSFCLLLARRHGSLLGIHLNPTLVEEGDKTYWQEFLEQDAMTFAALTEGQMNGFLRHASLEVIFELAQDLDLDTALRMVAGRPAAAPPGPSRAAMDQLAAAVPGRRGAGAEALLRNKETARQWLRRFVEESHRLPVPDPEGTASGIGELYRRLFAPLKAWLAEAGGVLAAELSLRYRAWRLDRGIQTYADQVETALSILKEESMLERIRAEGWRVILDEAQDTDSKQFAVLVEIARPPGALRQAWPGNGGPGPRPGHFCMVGDAQQGIYSDRADIRNFQRHVAAFENGNGGERLTFGVTFRAPRRVVRLLNATLPAAFGAGREHNLGLAPSDGARAPRLQVDYEELVAGPVNVEGAAWRLALPSTGAVGRGAVDRKLAGEAAEVARILAARGPGAVGADSWGDICVLAPRRAWLPIIRDQFEAAGLKTALQLRRNRNGDNPAYAWICGLLAVVCDPENTFEWVGVLREVFAVSDALIAAALGDEGSFRWDEPEDYPAPLAAAFRAMGPLIDRADAEGDSLTAFAEDLGAACDLRTKAHLADPDGGLVDEWDRLLARAADIGREGGGPRAWLRDLLGSIDGFRSAGRSTADAINLITAHSAKGLEWPVVIPVGLWRSIHNLRNAGLRIVPEAGGAHRVVFDNDGLGADTRVSLERERLRNLVRLLYVTLTRARTALVIPWSEDPPQKNSFAVLWGLDPHQLEPLPEVASALLAATPPPGADDVEVATAEAGGAAAGIRPFPRRILPHELAGGADPSRSALHEASLDQPQPIKDAADPLEYGVWWHETLEWVPWAGDLSAVQSHGAGCMANAAEKGFEQRGREEWDRLLASEPWTLVRDPRWTRLAEVGIFAPLEPVGWIDGVIDLVLHDPQSNELWIVDWKTNRRLPNEGEPELLKRLAASYLQQLSAYGLSASGFFPGCQLSLWIYSTVAGQWIRVGASA